MAARKDSNFSLFQPHLEKIVDIRKRYSDCFKPYTHIYDPLLDDYEPGLKTADVQEIFNALRPQQVELIKAISGRPQVEDSFICQQFDEQRQSDFGVEIATRMGFNWENGRQDRAMHPFTTTFGIKDVRITTKYNPHSGVSMLFSTMHETGHALYEQGINLNLSRTILATGASMAIHESQSRLWENLVGRSKAFWRFAYPRFQSLFPTQLGNVSLDAFYKGINKVEPSFIRTESDEATYNLHIMLRLELEIAMLEGKLAISDVPEAWNSKMRDYLGITPPDDAHGVLQDIHWSGGMIGYFPTYALGNLISAQVWEKVIEDQPNLEDQISGGDFSGLLAWLREKIHTYGAKFDPQVLVQKVTGQKINPQPYVRYLKTKYSEIYGM
jgi:carboxypeptidase Taq